MTPREELLRGFDTLVDNYHASRQETRAMLNQYAIGRWVSVEKRSPENGARCVVRGHDNKLFCADHFCNGIWDKYGYEPTVTHWLELDMPSGKDEA